MRAPYKVVVAGTGGIGEAVIKELMRLDEFEIVGVLGFRPRKEGRDAGELVGKEALGVAITLDKEAILKLDADCVIWCGYMPLPHIVEAMNDFVIQCLESGKHVITPACYHYPHIHGDAYVKRFREACQKGQTCLFGTGENPGFWFERLALTLTGLCNDVDYIGVDEYCNIALTTGSAKMWNAAGFGVTVEQAGDLKGLRETWEKYLFKETFALLGKSIYDKPLERFEMRTEYFLAEKSFELSEAKGDPFDMEIAAGTVEALSHQFSGYIDGELRFYAATNNFLHPEHSPFEGKPDSTWDIEIEGKPTSIKCSVEAMASVKENQSFYPGDSTSPLYYASIGPIIQAIPVLCGHEPGIVYPSMFASCAPDLRMLETRSSVVG